MTTIQEKFVEELIFMNASKRDLVIYEDGHLIIHDELGLEYSFVREIPSNVIVKGNLDLSNTRYLRKIGDNVCVEGNLILKSSSIKELGNNLKVFGDLEIYNCQIKTLPEDIVVKGALRIRDIKELTKIEDDSEDVQVIGKRVRDIKRIKIQNNEQLSSFVLEEGLISEENIKMDADQLIIGSSLDLTKYYIEAFNVNLLINGDLCLRKVKDISGEITVNGTLDMSYGGIGNFNALVNVNGDMDLHGSKIENLPEKLVVGGNLDLSFSEIVSIKGNVSVGGNLNLAHTTELEEISENVKVGKRLILNDSRLNSKRIKEASKEGCLPDNTVIEGNIRFSPYDVDVRKIGSNVKIYGNAEFSHLCIEDIGNNFTVYGNLKLERVNINSIGDGLTIYQDVHIIHSSIRHIGRSNIQGKLILDTANINLLADTKIGAYIYSKDSSVTNTGDYVIYNFNDFISQFQGYIGATEYYVKREVEEYFKLDLEIKRLADRLEISELTNKLLKLEETSLLNEFLRVLHKACTIIDEDPSILSSSYDHIVFQWQEGYIKCFIKKHRENLSVDDYELKNYKQLKDEISLIGGSQNREDYDLLLELIVSKVLIRDFTLLQMNKNMDMMKKWGDILAREMYYRFLEEDEEDEPMDYTLITVLNVLRGEFRFLLGNYDRW